MYFSGELWLVVTASAVGRQSRHLPSAFMNVQIRFGGGASHGRYGGC
jgi:hypothetical protein